MDKEKDNKDLLGSALRRAFRVARNADERFDDLLRRLAERDGGKTGQR